MAKVVAAILLAAMLASCASSGRIANKPIAEGGEKPYSFAQMVKNGVFSRDDVLLLSFSGGGTRSAALSYGVLQELRDTTVMSEGKRVRLLDRVDVISAVSGGSFTAAYYGLHGDGIFEDFEDAFLRNDFETPLIRGVLAPWHWISNRGRTELAIEMYDDFIFHGATFADMQRPGAPLVMINATDLGQGLRFSFIQEYFDLLCSDISTFPVSRAVAASSAVPVMFTPVVLRNYPDCDIKDAAWFKHAAEINAGDDEMLAVIRSLQSYHDKKRRPYIHYVDGGISDNLGLRAIREFTELSGGAPAILQRLQRPPAHTVVVISVDASTEPTRSMDETPEQPSLNKVINAVTDVQLHRYNAATIKQVSETLAEWSDDFSMPDKPVKWYFIQLRLTDMGDPEQRKYMNNIPTSFDLDDKQVDMLIKTGRKLLQENPEFQHFLNESQ